MVDAAGRVPTLKINVRLSADSDPPKAIGVSPLNSAAAPELNVFGFIDFEKVATTLVLRPTLSVPSGGETATTVGAVVSVTLAVVNELMKKSALLPARSCTKVKLLTCTLNEVLPGSGDSGVKVTIAPDTA